MAKASPPSNLATELGKRKPFSSLRQETYLNLVRTHEHLASQFARFFRQHALSDAQYNALRILRGEAQPMQLCQIAERMVSTQTDISRLVHRLHTGGWVHRRLCQEDRRVVWVSLTQKAQDQLQQMDRPLERLHEAQFAELTDRELATLNRLLFKARKPEA
ncbi:MarR family winged helix-turn-helix transcriptional regulator [Lignipirellula cremea]|uniref:Transcriptional repressor MprA n=1 Tax=Lignipirellula cremea TaxID=2528010 RepID=A0A518DXQ9_9BACT|nr:MarR family transcriptional regulator [Lignipirellula cremea]QDU96633.1 transcriptional repressor MprA [Lignipirellula cremea]